MTRLVTWWRNLSPSTRTEVKRDAVVFLAALASTGILDGNHPTVAGVVAAIVLAVKVTARQVFPHDDVPPPAEPDGGA